MPYSNQPIRKCVTCKKDFHCKTNSNFCDNCRKPVTRTCIVCGKSFEYRPSLKSKGLTCSNTCGAKYRWRNAEQDRAARRPPCSFCGKPITRKYINLGARKGKDIFCNTACYGKWRAENIKGELHPRFNGGYKGYYGVTWIIQRALARKRDKVCQRCGKTPKENGKALDVHHIIPFRKFTINKEHEANRLDNLICYCVSCHQIAEKSSR